jgi:hypothetical protein
MDSLHKRATLLGGLFVFLTSLVVYVLTMSPTVAFWDCGEYVASMHSLGVPHPPGNPLFIMMGRVASILFFFLPDVGYRINLLVALISAATVLLVYLISVRTLVGAMGIPQSRWGRITIHLPSVMGALLAGFGYTFWFSAVEQSECNASVLFVVLSAWIALVWAQSKNAGRDRLLLLLAYVVYLGIGVHMMSMLALLPAFLFVIMIDRAKLTDWRLWLTCGLMGAVIYNVSFFLLIGPLVGVATLAFSFIKGDEGRKWRFCFFIAAFALLGYSVHFYIPTRAALNPVIDENHPVVTLGKSGVEWSAFRGFLERKQYGSESMISRMFWRRGSWTKQFGIDGHGLRRLPHHPVLPLRPLGGHRPPEDRHPELRPGRRRGATAGVPAAHLPDALGLVLSLQPQQTGRDLPDLAVPDHLGGAGAVHEFRRRLPCRETRLRRLGAGRQARRHAHRPPRGAHPRLLLHPRLRLLRHVAGHLRQLPAAGARRKPPEIRPHRSGARDGDARGGRPRPAAGAEPAREHPPGRLDPLRLRLQPADVLRPRRRALYKRR